MRVARQISTLASLDSDREYDAVLLTAVGMSGKCHNRQNDHHHHHQQPQQPHQRQRSARFKGVVRRVLVALSLRVGHRPAEPPPPSLAAAATAADSGDDSLEGGDGCGGRLIMTSTSTVTTTVCRLAAVEEERRSRCNSLVSPSANRVNRCDHNN